MPRPSTGDLVAYCTSTTLHNCIYPYDYCQASYGIVGVYMPGYTQDAVPVKTLGNGWTLTSIKRVWPAVFTFVGPIRRDWRFL